MNLQHDSYLEVPFPESLSADGLSIAVIGPDGKLRKAIVSSLADYHQGEIHEFTTYPPSLDDLPRLLQLEHDIILIECDSNPEYALDLVEGICASGKATVMVYSRETDPELSDPDLLMRCMRAGAREFLSKPFGSSIVAEALVRAAARRPPARVAKKSSGRLLVFCGAKGGAGVTAIACNFAVALARESAQSTLLIDLDLPLGGVALSLGVTTEYSTTDALESFNRLDASLLSKLLSKHSSGVSVLAAPGRFTEYRTSPEAIERLLTVARQGFENVVVDMGSKLDSSNGADPFKDATTVYLVTQTGIPELRNANRLISQYFSGDTSNLEIVLNRHESRGMRVSDEDINKALTQPAKWKIPNDYAAMRRMQDSTTPTTLTDSPIYRLLGQMARSASGLPDIPVKDKKGLSLKDLTKGMWAKGSKSASSFSISPLRLTGDPDDAETDAEPEADGAQGYTTPKIADFSDFAEAKREALDKDRMAPPATRIYNGATYVKAADGQWHLKDSDEDEVEDSIAEAPVVDLPSPNFRQARATIDWPAPAPIVYGTELDATVFNAVASGPGTLIYTPAEGTVLPVGTHTLWATLIAAGNQHSLPVQASVTLSVSQATPVIDWPIPPAICCGTALSAAQLNATTSVPGTFVYSPAEGELLGQGTHRLSVIFIPADSVNFTQAHAEASISVTTVATSIVWEAPPAISYGTLLGAEHLNATASTAGTFSYQPAEGSVLGVGKHTLSVVFTPADAMRYTGAHAEVSITVTKGRPAVTWPTPNAIVYGSPLSAAELNATSSVPGTFVYIPGEGAVLAAGKHKPSVVFTPFDTTNYNIVQASVSLTVSKEKPSISWTAPDTISYGTELSAAQLNATASVLGRFTYTPAEGALLGEGRHTIRVAFAPTDATNYTGAEERVSITVTKPTPVHIEWLSATPIAYGTVLNSSHLNATASVPGTFAYTPSEGSILPAGTHQLSVEFHPADANLPAAQASIELEVFRATPVVRWSPPKSITSGTALSSVELNAVPSVPGTLIYTPAEGDVLPAGMQTLSLNFIPTDTANYTGVQAEITLSVTKATPRIIWSSPAPICYGTALGEAQLNAAVSLPGTFIYAPVKGTVLPAGDQTLSVTFIPADHTDYLTAQATVRLVVEELDNTDEFSPRTVDANVSESTQAPAPHSADFLDKSRRAEMDMSVRDEFTETDPVGDTEMVFTSIIRPGPNSANLTSSPHENIPSLIIEEETRTYKGATYKKGTDGQWHIQQA